MCIKTNDQPKAESNDCVNYGKEQFYDYYAAEVLIKQLAVLCNVTVVVVGDTKIQEDIEQKREVEYHKIKPIFPCTNNILNRSVDPKDPKGFDQKV